MIKSVLISFILIISLTYAKTADRSSVSKLYIAILDRAPDSAGLNYWLESGLSLEDISKSFFDQREVKERYPEKLEFEEFIDSVYTNCFNHKADKEGLEYWKKEYEKGMSIDRITLAVTEGATSYDRERLDNKTKAALKFAEKGIDDLDKAREAIKDITANPWSVHTAMIRTGLESEPAPSVPAEERDKTVKETESLAVSKNVLPVKSDLSKKENDTALSLVTLPNSLRVKGWKDYLSMGTVTDDSVTQSGYIAESGVDAIFKYAGNGAGDRGRVIDPIYTIKTITLAREAEKITGKRVLPVMVVYTANSSGGGLSEADILNYNNLVKHFRVLIRIASTMQSQKESTHQSPASIVLNPDLFGEWQKSTQNGGFYSVYCGGIDDVSCSEPKDIDIVKALNEAIDLERDYRYGFREGDLKSVYDLESLKDDISEKISNDIFGWVEAQNFVIKQFAPDVSFGWVVNLWNPGTALWVHDEYPSAEEPADSVVDFMNFIGAYNNEYRPDFLAFDKYERDGFSPAGRPYYAFGAREWKNYLYYVKNITDSINTPAMLWQIPGGHMATKDEETAFDYIGHAASGGDFFMGDENIGSEIDNIRDDVLNIPLNPGIYNGAANVRELLEGDIEHDWSKPQLESTVESNVFAILWGGGETTGVIPISTCMSGGYEWLAQRIRAYENISIENDNDNLAWDTDYSADDSDNNENLGDKKEIESNGSIKNAKDENSVIEDNSDNGTVADNDNSEDKESYNDDNYSDSEENDNANGYDEDTSSDYVGSNSNTDGGEIEPYDADKASGYIAGKSMVTGTDGRVYRCKPFPEGEWCKIAAYVPGGEGGIWKDAWDVVENGSNSDTSTSDEEIAEYDKNAAVTYRPGITKVIGLDGGIYRCKPYPEGEWCKLDAYAPGRDDGIWKDAWERVE